MMQEDVMSQGRAISDSTLLRVAIGSRVVIVDHRAAMDRGSSL